MIGCRHCSWEHQSGKRSCKTASLAAAKLEEKQYMGNEQFVIVLLTVLCILEGLVFIEVRRLRKGTGPK